MLLVIYCVDFFDSIPLDSFYWCDIFFCHSFEKTRLFCKYILDKVKIDSQSQNNDPQRARGRWKGLKGMTSTMEMTVSTECHNLLLCQTRPTYPT